MCINRGFTLIEVLVTLIILMFGLLGIAGLMAKGQRASFEAYQRQQALALANDMAERMRANRTQAAAYAAGAPVGTPVGSGNLYNNLAVNCGAAGANCTTPQLATYDVAQWDGLLMGYAERQTGTANRIGGIIRATGCVQDISPAAAPACPVAPPPGTPTVVRNFRISVAWQGNEDLGAVAFPSACGVGTYGQPGQRRIVSLDVLLIC